MKSNLLLSKGLHKLTDHASKLHTVSSFNEVCLQLLKYHRNSPTERFTDKTLHYRRGLSKSAKKSIRFKTSSRDYCIWSWKYWPWNETDSKSLRISCWDRIFFLKSLNKQNFGNLVRTSRQEDAVYRAIASVT